MAYQKKQYVIRPVFDILEGKSAGLNQKNLLILRFLFNAMGLTFFKVLSPVLITSISLTILSQVYYAYTNYGVNYNPVITLIWAIYYCFVISQMVLTMVISFGVLIIFSLYIKFRFNQVNQLFKSNNIQMIKLAIGIHKSLCNEVEDIKCTICFRSS